MSVDESIRNMRDFLTIYNKMAESCFNQCVEFFGSTKLSDSEVQCVETCAGKNIQVNHKLMGVYVEVHPEMVDKRVKEFELQQEQLLQQQQEQLNAVQTGELPS